MSSTKDSEMNNEEVPLDMKYPTVRRLDFRKNTYCGVEVPNPYEYLEDPAKEETRAFVQDQNVLFESFMSQSTHRKEIQQSLTAAWLCPFLGVPMKKGSRMFYWKNTGTQNHNALWVNEALDGSGEVRKILDPNLWDKEGKFSIGNIGISNDGKMIAYAVSENGSDWQTIKIRDVDCGHDLDDRLSYAKLTTIKWTKDHKGFFYQRYPKLGNAHGKETAANHQAKIYYHVVGTIQEDDPVAIEFPNNPSWTMGLEISDDGDYLFIQASDMVGEKYLFFVSLKDQEITGKLRLTRLFSTPGNHWYLANDEAVFYLMTTVGTRNFHQVVRVDVTEGSKGKFEVLVPEQKRIQWAMVVNRDKLVICYVKDILSRIEVRNLNTGNIIDQLAIDAGNASAWSGKRNDNVFFFKLESYVNPGVVYKVEFADNDTMSMQAMKPVEYIALNLQDFKMSMFHYSSNDGTNIPLVMVHKKNMVQDSNRPCLYTAYGGYGFMRLPQFHPEYLSFVNQFDGIVAISNIRGGSELGNSWWEDGRLLKKKNCFEDFISGTNFLINNNYTRPEKLAITGHSNGGMLIGACVNQRPQLFGAAVPRMGIMDMLRYNKFTVGHLWIGEFGNPEDATHFKYLRDYSPLHNIKAPEQGQFPAILVTTADEDDRVVSSHSYKYIAELQYMASTNHQRQKNPVLCKTFSNAGHYGESKQSKIQEWADIFAFLQLTLGYDMTKTS